MPGTEIPNRLGPRPRENSLFLQRVEALPSRERGHGCFEFKVLSVRLGSRHPSLKRIKVTKEFQVLPHTHMVFFDSLKLTAQETNT